MNKKIVQFDLKDLLPIGFLVIVIGLGFMYGIEIVGDQKSDECTADGGAYRASDEQCYQNSSYLVKQENDVFTAFDNTNDAIVKVPAKLGTLVSVVLAAVVIGTLVTFLYQKFA